MTRRIWASAITSLLLVTAGNAQAWSVSARRDPLTGNVRTSALLAPTQLEGARTARPMLALRCDEDGLLEAYVSTDRVLGEGASVRLRWGREETITEQWVIGDGMTSVFSQDAHSFALNLLKYRQMAIRLPVYSHGYVTAVYRIPALPTRLRSALERQCGLATSSDIAAREVNEAERRQLVERIRLRAATELLDRQRRDSLAALPGRLADATCKVERDAYVARRDSARRGADSAQNSKAMNYLNDITSFDFTGCRTRALVHIRDSVAALPKR